MVSADPCCVAPPLRPAPLLDHCLDSFHGRQKPAPLHHQNHHQRQQPNQHQDHQCQQQQPPRQHQQQIIPDKAPSSSSNYTSRPSTPSSTSSSSVMSSRTGSKPRTREIPSRYKSPTPNTTEVPSRYKHTPPPPTITSTSSRRFASPCVDRNLIGVTAASPSPKRAISADHRRPSPSRTSAYAATNSGDGPTAALPPRRTSNATVSARSEILWPSTRSLYTSMQSEPSSPTPVKPRSDSRGRSNSNLSSDHTLRPSPNSAAQKPVDQRKKTPERKGTPVRRHSLDQVENAKPAESVNYTKPDQPVLQHRWPSSLSTLKLYGSLVSRSIDLGDRLSSRGNMNLMQARPTSFSSKVIPRGASNSTGVLSQSINDGPNCSVFRTAVRKLTMDNKTTRPSSTRESPSRNRRLVSSFDGSIRHIIASSESELSVDLVRQSEEEDDEAELASAASTDDTVSVDTSTMASFSSQSVKSGRLSSTRLHETQMPGRSRTPLRLSTPDTNGSTVLSAGGWSSSASRQKVTPSGEPRAGHTVGSPWPGLLPSTANTYKFSQQQPLSPIKVSISARSLPSPTRSRVSTSLSPSNSASTLSRSSSMNSTMVHTAVDPRKSRKGLSQVEAAYLHRILHNRLLQWRFANARADFANTTQRLTGEKLLFSVWARTAEIRKSVTTKRIQLLQARRQCKLTTILRQQGSKLEEWYNVQRQHNTALSGVVDALDSAVLRVPVNEGVKADVRSVKQAMISAVDLVHTLESSMNQLLPKMEKTNGLVAELAQVANQERTLLEECGDLLSLVSSLEVEERSLRTQLLQFEQEKARVLGNLIGRNGSII